jgi:hypothetical protein
MVVDVEQLVVNWLRTQTAITDVVADRVYTDLPNDRTYPLILVNRTGGGYLYKQWLDAAEILIGCFGGSHKTAASLASSVLSSLDGAFVGTHPEGVTTGIRGTSIAYDPEPDSADPSGHARPRYTVTATVLAHP